MFLHLLICIDIKKELYMHIYRHDKFACNLNSGTSSERVFLCYKKDKSGNPITDITVIFPGKFLYVYIYTNMNIYVHLFIDLCICICMYICVYSYYVYIYMYMNVSGFLMDIKICVLYLHVVIFSHIYINILEFI